MKKGDERGRKERGGMRKKDKREGEKEKNEREGGWFKNSNQNSKNYAQPQKFQSNGQSSVHSAFS